MSRKQKTISEELKGTASEIITQVKTLIRKGNARHLVIRNKKGRILFQSQLTAGVAGTALIIAMAPIASAIALFLLFVNDTSVIVERDVKPGEDQYEVDADIIDITDEEDH